MSNAAAGICAPSDGMVLVKPGTKVEGAGLRYAQCSWFIPKVTRRFEIFTATVLALCTGALPCIRDSCVWIKSDGQVFTYFWQNRVYVYKPENIALTLTRVSKRALKDLLPIYCRTFVRVVLWIFTSQSSAN